MKTSRFTDSQVRKGWAVSSPKCNKLMVMLKKVKVVRHEQFGGAPEVEAFAWPGIELPGNGVQFGLRELRKIGALWKVLAKKAVGVLVDASLPGAVRIGKVDCDPRDFRKSFVLGHLAPLIVGQGQTLLCVNAVQDGAKSGCCSIGGSVFHLGQCHKERGSFDQRADGRRIASALDQVPFPVTGNDSLINFRGAQVNTGHVGDRAATVFTPGTRTAALTCLAKTGNQLSAQRPAWHGVERCVDGFVANLKGRFVRVHPAQYACDLFWRMIAPQKTLDMAPQWPIHRQPRGTGGRPRQPISSLLRKRRAIPASYERTPALLGLQCRIVPTIAIQLSADRTRRTLHAAGNCPQRAALLKT